MVNLLRVSKRSTELMEKFEAHLSLENLIERKIVPSPAEVQKKMFQRIYQERIKIEFAISNGLRD